MIPMTDDSKSFLEVVDTVSKQLSNGEKTMLDLRRSNPNITATAIGKALSHLKKEGKIDSDNTRPKTYWRVD